MSTTKKNLVRKIHLDFDFLSISYIRSYWTAVPGFWTGHESEGAPWILEIGVVYTLRTETVQRNVAEL